MLVNLLVSLGLNHFATVLKDRCGLSNILQSDRSDVCGNSSGSSISIGIRRNINSSMDGQVGSEDGGQGVSLLNIGSSMQIPAPILYRTEQPLLSPFHHQLSAPAKCSDISINKNRIANINELERFNNENNL